MFTAMPATSALKIPAFRNLLASRALAIFAMQIQAIVTAWQVYQIKHDPFYLGLIGLAEAAPALSVALFAGDFVDRHNPLSTYRGMLAGFSISAVTLLIASLPSVPLSPATRLALIYSAAFAGGCARGFSQPSMYSIVPRLVPRELLGNATAWNTSAFQIASVLGPALGGMLYAFASAPLPYALDCVMLALAFVFSLTTKLEDAPPRPASTETAATRIKHGLKFVFSNEILVGAMALDMFAVLFGGVEAMLPIFAAEILKVGASGLGILQAAPAVGALIGGGLMIRRSIKRGAGKVLLSVVAGFGICIIAFALSRVFWMSLILLGMAGALDSVSMVIRGTIVQISSPDHMRGRISSVNSIFIGMSNEIGAFESGVAAKLMGTIPSVIFGGALTLVTVAVAAVWTPKLRELHLEDA